MNSASDKRRGAFIFFGGSRSGCAGGHLAFARLVMARVPLFCCARCVPVHGERQEANGPPMPVDMAMACG